VRWILFSCVVLRVFQAQSCCDLAPQSVRRRPTDATFQKNLFLSAMIPHGPIPGFAAAVTSLHPFWGRCSLRTTFRVASREERSLAFLCFFFWCGGLFCCVFFSFFFGGFFCRVPASFGQDSTPSRSFYPFPPLSHDASNHFDDSPVSEH